jgi:hypothetical protein
MEPSMWPVSVISWKAAYGPQVKKDVCALNKKIIGGNNKMIFERGSDVMKHVYYRLDVKRQI